MPECFQGTGVASALVQAAETRLAAAGLCKVQIEYSFHLGDPLAERLFAWYEDTLGYVGPRDGKRSGFRMCRKRLSPGGTTWGSVLAWLLAIFRWLCCGQY